VTRLARVEEAYRLASGRWAEADYTGEDRIVIFVLNADDADVPDDEDDEDEVMS